MNPVNQKDYIRAKEEGREKGGRETRGEADRRKGEAKRGRRVERGRGGREEGRVCVCVCVGGGGGGIRVGRRERITGQR